MFITILFCTLTLPEMTEVSGGFFQITQRAQPFKIHVARHTTLCRCNRRTSAKSSRCVPPNAGSAPSPSIREHNADLLKILHWAMPLFTNEGSPRVEMICRFPALSVYHRLIFPGLASTIL